MILGSRHRVTSSRRLVPAGGARRGSGPASASRPAPTFARSFLQAYKPNLALPTALLHHITQKRCYQSRPAAYNAAPAATSQPGDIYLQYLTEKGLNYKFSDTDPDRIRIRVCPFCPDTKGSAENLYKLYIYRSSAQYHCFRCGVHGHWSEFTNRISGGGDAAAEAPMRKIPARSAPSSAPSRPSYPRPASYGGSSYGGSSYGGSSYNSYTQSAPPPRTPLPKATSTPGADKTKIPDAGKLEKHINNLKLLSVAKNYLVGQRKLTEETLSKYKVGATVFKVRQKNAKGVEEFVEHTCISFPWIDSDGTVVRIKTRSITDKTLQRLDPTGGSWGFFGWHLLKKDAKRVIVTEGEFDAMAVYQATGEPAISLPAGANCFPPEVVQMLEKFDKIILWMDDDVPGQDGAKKFANKIGREKCLIVQTRGGAAEGPKDANDALKEGLDLKALLASAKPIPHKELLSFNELKTEIFRELSNPDQVAGFKSSFFPTLTKILKGHRKGELTILTGPTGVGKTTLLSQLSLDFMLQGVKTMWGSFEINNVRLAKKMISQFAQKNLESNLEEFEAVADQFEELPLYMMRFHGSAELEEVLDAMEYAVYVYDVEHIILDNLQFMMSTTMLNRGGYDKFDQLDTAVAKLRKFATTRNVHITLIIHPRKEDDGKALGTSSVFGTAKATQEADNVVVIQKGKNYRYLEVVKNRFSGDLGKVPYEFNQDGVRYLELSPERKAELEGRKYHSNKAPGASPAATHKDSEEFADEEASVVAHKASAAFEAATQ